VIHASPPFPSSSKTPHSRALIPSAAAGFAPRDVAVASLALRAPARDLRSPSIAAKVYNSHESSQTKILSFLTFSLIAQVCLEGVVNPDKSL